MVFLGASAGVPLLRDCVWLCLSVWPIAMITAIISLALYVRWPIRAVPWYLLLNFAVNISGLLFTLAIFIRPERFMSYPSH
jgi:hypothetical protein